MKSILKDSLVVLIVVFMSQIRELFTINVLKDDSTCYCLHEEISSLRNPVHIEPVVFSGKRIYFLAEQIGMIYEYHPEVTKNKLRTYLDITELVVCKHELYEERGLLGLALHPKFEVNEKIYTYSIRSINNKDYVVISEITKKDVSKERLLILIEQPGDRRNGGQLLFGDDGYLYIFVGDGGPSDDKNIRAQDGVSFLGKVLRIDVDKTTVYDNHFRYYDIPKDNPNETDWKPEVYAMGARNMWRCSKDRGDKQGQGKGRIFCGDLGSSLADELVELKKGGNYGWPYMEGNICRDEDMCKTLVGKTVHPIHEIRQGDNTSKVVAVVSGPLYRGTTFPEIYGQLLYGDYSTGATFTLKEPSKNAIPQTWASSDFKRCDKSMCACNARASQRTMLLSFGETHEGEVLLLMTDEPSPHKPAGAVLRLKPRQSKPLTCGVGSTLAELWIHYLSCILVLIYYII
ncbi:HHIP-like protein 2 [Ruditapes philippinarum]|uniref:HHIP-like protein 2 n=1 Tax=Ruditapes philippinarum TaxID=129788 RepID=UPI00295B26D0|nr:HHIP-like protein 2 [Ruditapes philippinarum]XP_060568297.1 HHIP-like protein 2 [Ruditapes philippinarum]